MIGTPYYMSPEQLRGRSDVDGRADVYSVGVILFELLTGRLPFREDNVGDLMVAITVKGPPLLAQLRPELGEALARVVLRALAADPEQRYASALELREALLAVLPSLPADVESVVQSGADGAHGPVTGIQPARTPFSGAGASRTFNVGRVPMPLWILALALLLVGMVVVWWPTGCRAARLRRCRCTHRASRAIQRCRAGRSSTVQYPPPLALPEHGAPPSPVEPAAVSGRAGAPAAQPAVNDAQRAPSKRVAPRAPRAAMPAFARSQVSGHQESYAA